MQPDATTLTRREHRESDNRAVPRAAGRSCDRRSGLFQAPAGAGAPLTGAELAGSEARGFWWVVGAFLICPCHLPITLAVAGTLLAGTALGAALSNHPVIAGVAITVAWAAATWRGFRLMRSGGRSIRARRVP